MDAGSLRDAVTGWGVADRGSPIARGGTGRVSRPPSGVGIALVAVAVTAVAAVATVFAAVDGASSLRSAGPLAGLLGTGLLGLAVSGDRDDGVAELVADVERVRDGEDVTFETDRADGLGDLAEAVEGLAADLRECERERSLQERVIESAPVGITVADVTEPDEPLVAVNDRFEALTGYDESECLGDNCRFLQGEDTDEESVAQLRRAIDEETETTVELRNYRADGTEFWNRVRLAPVTDDDGEVTHYVGFQEDVTERIERQAELDRERSLLDSIFDQVPIHLYVKDREGRYERVSSAYFDEVYDWDAERVVGQTDPELFDDELAAESHADDLRVVETGKPIVGKEEYVPDVEEWNLTTKVPWRGPDGAVRGLFGVSQKITERKQRERDLARYREYTDEILDAIDDVFYVLDADGDLVRWNETLTEVTGYDDAEIDDMHATDFVVEADREAVRRGIANIEDLAGVPLEARFETNGGEVIPFEIVASPMENPDGERIVSGIARDITERKAAEERLRDRERRLQEYREYTEDVLDAIDDVFYVFDDTGAIQRWNDTVAAVTGYDDETIAEMHGTDFFPEHAREDVVEAIGSVFEDGEERVDAPVLTSDGEEIPYEFVASMLETPDGDSVLVGIGRDVSERKARERELRATKERMQKFVETSPVGVVATDPEGTVTLWNDAMAEIFGWSADDVLGEPYPAVPGDRDDDEIRQRALSGESFSGVERERVRGDGERIDISLSTAPIRDDEGAVTELVGYIEDITERKERERELERTKDLLQQAGRIAAIGGWELDLTGSEREMTWTDELYRLHGVSPDTDIDLETAVGFYHPDDRERIRDNFRRAVEVGESYDMEVRLETGESPRWVRAIGEPVRDDDGEVVRVRGSIQDITPQKERELALQSLHEATRDLLGVETDAETAELVVDTAQSVLDVAGVAVYLLDDTANHLDAVACSEGFERLCDATPVGAGAADSLLWNTYVTGTPTVFDDTGTVAESQVFGSAVSGGLLVPVGDHGVFVVATEDRAVGGSTRQLAETLVATTEAAFDRLASERTLRERDAELAEQNARLRRQIGITDLIRRIDQSLIQAESREAIEAAVCDRLVESDDVAFAWIGGLDAAGERVEPSAWAGEGAEYLDAVALAVGGDEPAARTAAVEAPTVVGNVVDDLQREDWRKAALAREFHSVVSVPLAFEEYFYGVLTVYASEPDDFGDLEREVFAELGENIAHSISAVETQRALHTDQRIELTLSFDAGDDVLGRLARTADCSVAFEGLATDSESETGLFLTTAGASVESVTDALDALVSVADYRLVGEPTVDADGADGGADAETSAVFEVTVDGDSLAAAFVRHGADPRSLRADPEGIEAVVDVSAATDVRAFVEMLGETYPGVELTTRRTVDRSDDRERRAGSAFEALTDRQLEVLRTAYYAGFFEWPRTSTGEDVAEMLHVSQPTVNRHLRVGQQRLLDRLFDEYTVAAEAE
jgi:PAS domain S-box-containing protein